MVMCITLDCTPLHYQSCFVPLECSCTCVFVGLCYHIIAVLLYLCIATGCMLRRV